MDAEKALYIMTIAIGLGLLIPGIAGFLIHRPTPQLEVVKPDPWAMLFGFPVGSWQWVFAWRPVNTTDGGWIWMRYYWRRRIQPLNHLPGPTLFSWQCVINPTYNGSFLS